MKIIRRIEIATILVVALNLIFEFLFHISIKIIPKFFIVSLCTVVLFLTSVVSVFLHLSKNKSKIFKYSCKAIISLFLSLILLINVPFNYKTERLSFTHSDYEIVISRYYVMTVQRIQVLVTDNSVFAHEILYVGLPTGDFDLSDSVKISWSSDDCFELIYKPTLSHSYSWKYNFKDSEVTYLSSDEFEVSD